jgi:hypothetical protein
MNLSEKAGEIYSCFSPVSNGHIFNTNLLISLQRIIFFEILFPSLFDIC